jgi:DNA polymerase-3 subunit epsilon
MIKHAEWVGEWDDYHRSFRWQKLQGGDHSALGDCLATLEIIKKIAGK